MRFVRQLLIAVLLLTPSMLYGQATRDPASTRRPRPLTQQQIPEPCRRSDTQMEISGVDMDESRCFESVLQNVVDNLGQQLTVELAKEARMTAKQFLLEQDKSAAQARVESLNAELAWYRDYVSSTEPELAKLLDKAAAP